ncbi:hypothetical protein VTK73DRAFT_2041 [Phialemonium thermophilum]|uniref:Uncharacterized protein n=1 Tax=Phialemonium thermophilum TaxID=223376 RepID=A0ABR3VSM6_9PEZI
MGVTSPKKQSPDVFSTIWSGRIGVMTTPALTSETHSEKMATAAAAGLIFQSARIFVDVSESQKGRKPRQSCAAAPSRPPGVSETGTERRSETGGGNVRIPIADVRKHGTRPAAGERNGGSTGPRKEKGRKRSAGDGRRRRGS